MLPHNQRIRTAQLFGAVRRDGRSAYSALLVVGASARLEDTQTPARFGFIVSKRVGKAAVRNLVKRRMRAIALTVAQALAGWDIVVTAKPAAAAATFADLSRTMEAAINRLTHRAAMSPTTRA